MARHHMVSMKLTPAEKKVEGAVPALAEKPDYPYGLRIDLHDDSLAKLGISELPEVGTKFEIAAVAEVVATRQEDVEGGSEHKSITLQITDLGLYPSGEGRDLEKTLYGGEKSPLKAGGYDQ